MEHTTIGFAMTGSFCTFVPALEALKKLREHHSSIIPIMSEHAYFLDTRFGDAETHIQAVEELCGRPVLKTIQEVEPLGPKKMLVLATDVGAMGEMLASDCGLLFTSCSEQAVYDALCFAFENEAQMRLFARNAKTKTEERYALEKVFEKYKQLWCEIKNEPVRKNH